MSTALKPMTLEEFAKYANDVRFEFVDGEVVKRPTSTLSSCVGGFLHHLLTAYCVQTGVGRARPDNVAYRCFPGAPQRVRKPDVSWFVAARWSPSLFSTRYIEVAPDLIVEVLSPTDKAEYLNRKVRHFFEAGTKEAWVVYPENRQVERRFADGSGRWYSADEEIDAAPLIPGFKWKLADVLANV